MNWGLMRHFPWLDTRARFVATTPHKGRLLDLGSSDGETLGHFAELRQDLVFFAADKAGEPEKYPPGCTFQRVDFERENLPWPDRSMDAVTCMHLVEHLNDLNMLLRDAGPLNEANLAAKTAAALALVPPPRIAWRFQILRDDATGEIAEVIATPFEDAPA